MNGKESRVYGAVAEWLSRELNGLFRESLSQIIAPANMGVVLNADPERVVLIFINNDIGNIVLRPIPGTGLASGIVLTTADPVLAFNWRDHALLPTLEWFGRGSGGAASLIVVSVRREGKLSSK
jgi:hypothetical protein